MVSAEYRDLLVAVWHDENPGSFSARAEEEFGRATPPVRIHLPLDDRWFVQCAERLGELNPRELHYVGARLFDCLFQGEILRLYVHLLEQIRNTGARLRIRLALEPEIVAGLPWECAFDTRNGQYLSASEHVTLVRYRTPRGPEPEPAPARLPLRVLLVGGPGSGAPSRMSEEFRAIRKAMEELEGEGGLTLVESSFSPDHFRDLEALLAHPFDIVHFVCDAEDEAGVFRLVVGSDSLAADSLARILRPNRPALVAWRSAGRAARAGAALADALLDFVPAVVLSNGQMSPELLRQHESVFYRELSAMKPVDEALSQAQVSALSLFPPEGEWLPPLLFLSRRDASVVHHPSRGGITDVYQISEGRYRRRLRETLNRLWPKPERYFPQNLRWMPRLEPLSRYMHAADFLGAPQNVAELSRRFSRLLVLGGAGSGKSMALYRLFYEASQPILSYESKSPLPVYVSLPDLSESEDLFERLVQSFDRDLFVSDLEEGRFLFLLDSLDGLTSRGAVARTQALNAFMRKYPLNRYVATARQPPPKSIDIPNWAEVLPLTEWESLDFLLAGDAVRPEAARLLYAQMFKSFGSRAANPNLLALARRLYREGARLPSTATEIFRSFFRIAGASISTEARDHLLPQLAFFMTKRDRLSLLKRHLVRERMPGGATTLAAEDLAFRLAGARSADELLAEVEKTRLLRGPDAFTFPSAVFQEFLTAFALRLAAPSTILSLVPLADWRDLDDGPGYPLNWSRGAFHGVLPFLCGLRDDGPELVSRLVDRDLLLSAECYRETRPSTGADLALRAGVERALASDNEVDQRVACLSLSARGDRWALDWLLNVGARKGPARATALESLGRLRSHESIPLLESLISDTNPEVARAAQGALARIKVV